MSQWRCLAGALNSLTMPTDERHGDGLDASTYACVRQLGLHDVQASSEQMYEEHRPSSASTILAIVDTNNSGPYFPIDRCPQLTFPSARFAGTRRRAPNSE